MGQHCHREEGACDRRGAVSASERVLLGCDLMRLLEGFILLRRHKIATSLALLAMTYSKILMWAYLSG